MKHLLKVLVFIFSFNSLLFSENIYVNSSNYTDGIKSANDGDVIYFIDRYDINTTGTLTTNNTHIFGNNTILSGSNTHGIFETVPNGNFSGFSNITLRDANAGYYYGGAIYVRGDLTGNITNSNFIANSAGYGGAIMAHQNLNAIITNTNFTNNTANNHGGAIYVFGNSNATFDNVIFLGNNASTYGGALFFASTFNGIIQNSSFTNNYAGDQGERFMQVTFKELSPTQTSQITQQVMVERFLHT
ncbi:MAG: hypothetical protein ACK5LP_08820 [Campylobacteraceae bacterium]